MCDNMFMEEAIVIATKLGGSVAVIIPKKIADKEGIVEGEKIKVTIEKVRKDWFGAFKMLKPFKKEEEFDEHK